MSQDFSDYEVIIIDDGSTDNTAEVVSTYLVDPRFRYVHQANSERAVSRNTGTRLSGGDYITFLDSDDVFDPDHLSTVKAHLQDNPPVVWSPYDIIDNDGKILTELRDNGEEVLDRLIRDGNFLSCHGVFLRSDIARDFPFNEDRALSGTEDLELWFRLAARHPFLCLKKKTNSLIQHEGRSVFNFNDEEKLIARNELMLKYLHDNKDFMSKVGQSFPTIQARAYSYVALHALVNPYNSNKTAWRYFYKSLKANPAAMLDKRGMAIAKHGLLSLFNSNRPSS